MIKVELTFDEFKKICKYKNRYLCLRKYSNQPWSSNIRYTDLAKKDPITEYHMCTEEDNCPFFNKSVKIK